MINIAEVRPPIEWRPRPRRIQLAILAGGLLGATMLVLLDFFLIMLHQGLIGPLREIFWMTREESLATWLAVSQTLLVGLVLAAIAVVARRRPDQGSARLWWLLSLAFIYLAADDAAQIHERIGAVVKAIGDEAEGSLELLGAFPTYHWQLVFGLPLFGLAGLLVFFAGRQLRNRADRLLLITAVAMLATAVGLDFLEGLPPDHVLGVSGRLAAWLGDPWTVAWFGIDAAETAEHFLRVLEEFLEMLAMTLLLAAFAGHLVRTAGGIHLRPMD